jgi:hypothetical protein
MADSEDAFAASLEGRSATVAEIVTALREMVLTQAPGASEALRFGALSYFLAGRPFASIGGNICMIEIKPDGSVRLSFIHGAELDDPDRLLLGSGKAKRYLLIGSPRDARRPAVRALVRAAARRAQQEPPARSGRP